MAVTPRDEGAQSTGALATLDAHAVYLSEADEAEVFRRAAETDDVGELALRTCRCGVRVDGFDAYWEHLHEVFKQAG